MGGYTALYRKFRPMTFGEMVGQEHITKTLRNQIMANRVGHAYLFNGGRGTGKTSSAKILARAINCLNPQDGEPCNECEICKAAINGSLTDIVEMDAASNNSVEDVRSIREEVNFLPTKAKYRVYIIDEVHMLSTGAFNALLKTLEEPPEHVKFILATTEPQKLPATILSRCQRFDFKRISNEDVIKRLKIVCEESKIEITEGALNIISVLSEGAMRDALSILERCIQDGENKIDEDKIKDLVGIPKFDFVNRIVQAIFEYNVEEAIASTNEVLYQGKDLENFIWEMIKYVKDILIYQSCKKLDLYSENELEQIKKVAETVSKERLVQLIYTLSELQSNMKWSNQKSIVFQAGIIKLCANPLEGGGNVEERVGKIETYLKSGNFAKQVQTVGAGMHTPPMQTTTAVSARPVSQANQASIGNPVNPTTSAQSKTQNKPPKMQMAGVTGSIEKTWPKIVGNLKDNGKIVLYTNLINTEAKEINDMTVGIEFKRGITPFGKAVLEKQENIRELTNLVSMACGKEMQIKYIDASNKVNAVPTAEENIQNFANESEIPFNVIE